MAAGDLTAPPCLAALMFVPGFSCALGRSRYFGARMTIWDFQRVTQAFTTAATDPCQWTSALEVLSQETASAGAILFPVHGQTPFVPLSQSLRESTEFYFQNGWHTRDLRYLPAERIRR